jgi:hypothetical protein
MAPQVYMFDAFIHFVELESKILCCKLLIEHVSKLVDAHFTCLGSIKVVNLNICEVFVVYSLTEPSSIIQIVLCWPTTKTLTYDEQASN